MSFYADDAITMPPNDNIVIGKAAIAARYKAGFAKFKMEVSLSSDELEVCDDRAFNRGKTSGRLIWHDGSNPTPLNDKYLMILRRQADKSWKIARLMWSNYSKN
jgi:ketosteroid isomerase-like protein